MNGKNITLLPWMAGCDQTWWHISVQNSLLFVSLYIGRLVGSHGWTCVRNLQDGSSLFLLSPRMWRWKSWWETFRLYEGSLPALCNYFGLCHLNSSHHCQFCYCSQKHKSGRPIPILRACFLCCNPTWEDESKLKSKFLIGQLHRVTWWTRNDLEEPDLTDNENDETDEEHDTETQKPQPERKNRLLCLPVCRFDQFWFLANEIYFLWAISFLSIFSMPDRNQVSQVIQLDVRI